MLIRLITVTAMLTIAACTSTPQRTGHSTANTPHSQPTSQSDGSANASTSSANGKPIAYVNGQPLYASRMQTQLYEAAGGQVLSEEVLEMALRDRLQQRGLQVTQTMIEKERQIMLEALSPDPDEAVRLWREIRQRRGIGENRLKAMLWRNAALRLLVADQVDVTPLAIGQAYERRYGRKWIARIIVTPTSRLAGQARSRVMGGETFSEVAATMSIDATGPSGGMLPPISPNDATYPKVLRNTLQELNPGQISDVIATGDTFSIVKLERIREPESVQLDAVRDELAQQVRRQIERLRMQQLATGMIEDSRVVVLDPVLNQQWKQARNDD